MSFKQGPTDNTVNEWPLVEAKDVELLGTVPMLIGILSMIGQCLL